MWHEARKQEKYIKTVMVDVKKRAERRKVFYEKIKLDPIRFLRLYGGKYKISMEPEVAMAAENPSTMMVWSGDNSTVIDRFDVRTNLDCITSLSDNKAKKEHDERIHERMCNYERFRCLVHNQFAKVSETIALGQIDMVEKYGEDIHKLDNKDNKKKASEKAAIGYVYADTDYMHAGSNSDNDSDSQDSEPDLDMDLDIELDISRLSIPQQKELLKLSHQYGMNGNDYLKLMKLDKNREEDLRTAKLLEEQKAQFHGRKSRRERKIFKEQRLKERYMKQDPRTLSFGASSFREELYVGKHILTPSPKRDSKSESISPESNKRKVEPSKSLNDFVKVPTFRYGRDKSSSRSRGYYRSPSPIYGPRLPSSYNKDSRKKSTLYRDKMDNSRDRRRQHSDRYSRSPDRAARINRECGIKSDQDKISSHNYRLSKSKSPLLPEEDILKKKYYHSDPEEEKSSDSSSNISDDKIKNTSTRKESRHTKTHGGHHQHNDTICNSKFNPKDLLKKQMEIQLNKAYRADKKAEQEKQQKVEKERLDRENQLKEMAAQIRKRELERRRKERERSKSRSSSSSSSSDRKRSRSREQSNERYHYKSSPRRSRSTERSRRFYR